MEEQISKLINRAIEDKVFPGAVVLVSDEQKIEYLQAFGTTKYDDPGTTSIKPNFIYDIASLTKVFTFSAGLKLMEERKISLDTKVAEVLPEFDGEGKRGEITIWNLMTHSSGLSFKSSSFKNFPSKHIRRETLKASMVYKTGSKAFYDNINAILMAEVITAVSGEKFINYLKKEILEPMNLRDTCYKPSKKLLDKIVPTENDGWRMRLVHGEVHDEGTYALGGIAGHAGLFSTAKDLWTFGSMWLNNGSLNGRRILSPESITLATRKYTKGENGWMGLGWMINNHNWMDNAPDGTYGHTGFTGTSLLICPIKKKIIILLSNRIYPKRGSVEPISQVRTELAEIVLNDFKK